MTKRDGHRPDRHPRDVAAADENERLARQIGYLERARAPATENLEERLNRVEALLLSLAKRHLRDGSH